MSPRGADGDTDTQARTMRHAARPFSTGACWTRRTSSVTWRRSPCRAKCAIGWHALSAGRWAWPSGVPRRSRGSGASFTRCKPESLWRGNRTPLIIFVGSFHEILLSLFCEIFGNVGKKPKVITVKGWIVLKHLKSFETNEIFVLVFLLYSNLTKTLN